MKAAVAHSYPRHGGPVSGSSPESERGASPCLAVIIGQMVRGTFLVSSSPRKLDGLRPVLFSRDELKNRHGSGPPTRTVAIGGSERILVRSSRRQSIDQPLHDTVQGLPPHANSAHQERSL